MSESTLTELSASLRRGLRDLSPEFLSDVGDKGEELLLVTIHNPTDPHWGVTYEAHDAGNGHVTGCLWFGPCRVTGALDASDAEEAVRAVTGGEIAAVVRYRSEADYEDRRPSDRQRVFRLLPGAPDDGSADFAALIDRLRSAPGLVDRLRGDTLGVFEIARFGGVEVIRRGVKRG